MHIRFAYRWRLDPEKWVDMMVQTIQNLCSLPLDTAHTYQYDIRGVGMLTSEVQSLVDRFPAQVIYHGRVSHDVLMSEIQGTHYALMPSIFLETFGLTALEACQHSIPVIWYAKWGLKQFIIPELDCTCTSLQDLVTQCICDFDSVKRELYRRKVHLLSTQYTSQAWYDRFTRLLSEDL